MGLDPLALVFGSKPEVALWKNLSYGTEQKKSIENNLSAFPDIAKLGSLYQSYLTDQMNTALPGYSDILESGGRTTQATLDAAEPLLRGEIPQDIQDMVRRNSAYASSQGGFAGSGMASNLTARDFGLTSLNLMQQGANLASSGTNAAQRWSALASGQVLNPGNFFVNPSQQAGFDLQNQVLRTQSLQNKYNVAAAPDPAAKGISDTIINLLGAYLGAGKGGAGGTAANSYSPAGGGGSYNYSMNQSDPYNYADYSFLGLGAGGA